MPEGREDRKEARMSFVLGMDTGGTYTDGVIVDSTTRKIVRKAKAPTTRHDLAVGIKNCMDNLDFDKMEEISLASISTTLATNSIVEGRGAAVGLIYMGTELEEEVPAAITVKIKGRFDIMGRLQEDIDEKEIREVLSDMKGRVEAVAVSGYAGVRNPKHEKEVKRIAEEMLDVPVVCAHQLTSALGFHHRTVTAVLNGRFIPVIDRLLRSTRQVMEEKHISAPIMVVKGDGTLMTEDVAKDRPIETILSGPAASVIGALALTGRRDGLVLDMGGTTSDLADVTDGTVRIKKEGAKVGGWFTRVRAAEISTFGIGGDSRIYLDKKGNVRIGPEKVIPLCVVGKNDPQLMYELRSFWRGEIKGYFAHETDCYVYMGGGDESIMTEKERRMVETLKEGPHSISFVAGSVGDAPETTDLSHLVEAGIIARASLTPTDILHIKGRYTQWNRDLSLAGAKILAQRKEMNVNRFVDMVEASIHARLAMTCLQAAADFEGQEIDLSESPAAMYLISTAFGERTSPLLAPSLALKKPLVAIGAPAEAWLRDAAELLGGEIIVPEDADVANAYGAAVGQITESVELKISIDGDKYILNCPWERFVYGSREEAMFYAIHEGRKHIEHILAAAGCRSWTIDEKTSDIKVKTNDSETVSMGTDMVITGVGSLI